MYLSLNSVLNVHILVIIVYYEPNLAPISNMTQSPSNCLILFNVLDNIQSLKNLILECPPPE